MRKVLIQILIFTFLFTLIFTINRILMQNDFIPSDLVADKNELILMYLLGAFHDVRFLSAAFLPLLLCGFLTLLFRFKNKKLIGGGEGFILFFLVFISLF